MNGEQIAQQIVDIKSQIDELPYWRQRYAARAIVAKILFSDQHKTHEVKMIAEALEDVKNK